LEHISWPKNCAFTSLEAKVAEKTTKNYEIKGKGETILVGSDCIWCTTIDMDSGKSLNFLRGEVFDNKISHYFAWLVIVYWKFGKGRALGRFWELENSLGYFARRKKNNFQSNIGQKCQKGRFYGKFLH